MPITAIFGGAFDPITHAHIDICNYILDNKLADKVMILPCYKSHYDKKMAPPLERFTMCRLAINNPKIEVSDFEIINFLTGETLEILPKLMKQYPDDKFSFVIGMDNAVKINTWTDWEKLTALLPFIVLPREGYEPKDQWFLQKPHIYLKDYKANSVSSTQVRKDLIERGTSSLVDELVMEYIKMRKLYL